MVEYFIAFEPNKELYNKIFRTKKDILAKYGTQLFLEDLPHCTIYISVTKDLKDVENIINSISKNMDIIRITISKDYLKFSEDKLANGTSSIGISFDEASVFEIRQIQERIVNELNQIRIGIPTRYAKVNLPKVLDESMQTYGFPFVQDKQKTKILIPHFSFCHFLKKEDLIDFEKSKNINFFAGNYELDKIVIYKLNEDETCDKLNSYPLKRSNKR